MHTTVTVHPDISVTPRIDLYNDDHEPFVGVSLTQGTARIAILVHDPRFLEALARTCDEAAVRLSAALDTRAARAMNTQAGAA